MSDTCLTLLQELSAQRLPKVKKNRYTCSPYYYHQHQYHHYHHYYHYYCCCY